MNELRKAHKNMIEAKVQRLEIKSKYTALTTEEKEDLEKAKETLKMMKGEVGKL